MNLQLRESSFLFFIHNVVTGVVVSAFTPHSRRTSLPRMTFMFCGLVTIIIGSEENR